MVWLVPPFYRIGIFKWLLKNDPVQTIRQITGKGVHYALDTSGKAEVFEQAAQSIRIRGICGLIGGMATGQKLSVEANHLLVGRTMRGIIQGDSLPDTLIPQLLDLYRQGQFPFDKLVTFFDFADVNEAIEAMRTGQVIKPILRVAAQ